MGVSQASKLRGIKKTLPHPLCISLADFSDVRRRHFKEEKHEKIEKTSGHKRPVAAASGRNRHSHSGIHCGRFGRTTKSSGLTQAPTLSKESKATACSKRRLGKQPPTKNSYNPKEPEKKSL